MSRFKVWNCAAVHSDGGTWSTQLRGVGICLEDALATLQEHVTERLRYQERYGDTGVVVAAVAYDTDDHGVRHWQGRVDCNGQLEGLR